MASGLFRSAPDNNSPLEDAEEERSGLRNREVEVESVYYHDANAELQNRVKENADNIKKNADKIKEYSDSIKNDAIAELQNCGRENADNIKKNADKIKMLDLRNHKQASEVDDLEIRMDAKIERIVNKRVEQYLISHTDRIYNDIECLGKEFCVLPQNHAKYSEKLCSLKKESKKHFLILYNGDEEVKPCEASEDSVHQKKDDDALTQLKESSAENKRKRSAATMIESSTESNGNKRKKAGRPRTRGAMK